MRRGERWKYVLYSAGDEALYEPGADPYELTNLALDPAYGPVLAAEREALLAFLRTQGVPLPRA